jgi:hypothetical protein
MLVSALYCISKYRIKIHMDNMKQNEKHNGKKKEEKFVSRGRFKPKHTLFSCCPIIFGLISLGLISLDAMLASIALIICSLLLTQSLFNKILITNFAFWHFSAVNSATSQGISFPCIYEFSFLHPFLRYIFH